MSLKNKSTPKKMSVQYLLNRSNSSPKIVLSNLGVKLPITKIIDNIFGVWHIGSVFMNILLCIQHSKKYKNILLNLNDV